MYGNVQHAENAGRGIFIAVLGICAWGAGCTEIGTVLESVPLDAAGPSVSPSSSSTFPDATVPATDAGTVSDGATSTRDAGLALDAAHDSATLPEASLPPDAGGSLAACGGIAGLRCPSGEYCDYDSDQPCGRFDGAGICRTKPLAGTVQCPTVSPCQPACGCNGVTYCQACEAHAAGTDDDNAVDGGC